MKYKIYSKSKKLMADTLTPVNIYLKLRDVFAGSILLESSDYHGHENSLSLICCQPIATFQVKDAVVTTTYPDNSSAVENLTSKSQVLSALDRFRNAFDVEETQKNSAAKGLFGYMTYDAVRHFEDIELTITNKLIPDVLYKVFRYVIVVDHFSNELVLHENVVSESEPSGLEKLEKIIYSNRFSTFSFHSGEEEKSNLTNEQYVDMVKEGIRHCH